MADGVVEFLGTNLIPYRNGMHVGVRHGDGSLEFHGHIRYPKVKVGQRVKRGERLADTWRSGLSASAGIHNHCEWWLGKTYTTHTNPEPHMARHGWALVPDGNQRRLYDLEAAWAKALAAIGYRTGWTAKVIQEYLRDHGIYTGAVDGDLGPMTVRAIQTLLARQGVKITADGVRGQVTAVAEYRLVTKGLPVPAKIAAARKAAAAAKEAAKLTPATKHETQVKEAVMAVSKTVEELLEAQVKYRNHTTNKDQTVKLEDHLYFQSLGQDKVLDMLEAILEELKRIGQPAGPSVPTKE